MRKEDAPNAQCRRHAATQKPARRLAIDTIDAARLCNFKTRLLKDRITFATREPRTPFLLPRTY